ncbi:hypothetical protein T1E_0963 [Pseudomonas putida DOT-T1E]|uniref:Uncharacterized protein n=1 Tax=Pseudomonas putida (strain DOT-T1E) TaxID=1196325 RepID=I7C177_PSEPT|nr:hypothetical protein T1E_0963 [Pseudomonas putida DOT-T1E]
MPTALCTGANPGFGGQFAPQPGQLNFADLHPVDAPWCLAALLEGQAFAISVKAGISVVTRPFEELSPERGHGGESFALGLGARIRVWR